MRLIFNASPVIVLAKAGLIATFAAIADTTIIPDAVSEEILRVNDALDPACLWLAQASTKQLIRATPDTTAFISAWDLGSGEAAVIALAQLINDSVAVLDDLAARRCAQALGLKVTGTLGLVLIAKRKRMIPNVSDALDAIVAAGLYVAPKHLQAIRAAASE